jgi:hypothetical protein
MGASAFTSRASEARARTHTAAAASRPALSPLFIGTPARPRGGRTERRRAGPILYSRRVLHGPGSQATRHTPPSGAPPAKEARCKGGARQNHINLAAVPETAHRSLRCAVIQVTCASAHYWLTCSVRRGRAAGAPCIVGATARAPAPGAFAACAGAPCPLCKGSSPSTPGCLKVFETKPHGLGPSNRFGGRRRALRPPRRSLRSDGTRVLVRPSLLSSEGPPNAGPSTQRC